eukprot:3629401-Lingulodinium_polyedra.AAC.1
MPARPLHNADVVDGDTDGRFQSNNLLRRHCCRDCWGPALWASSRAIASTDERTSAAMLTALAAALPAAALAALTSK